MAWFKRPKYTIVKAEKKSEVPQGVFHKCEQCGAILLDKELEDNFNVCPKCGNHRNLLAVDRIRLLIDEGTWHPHPLKARSSDPLKFPDYAPKLKRAKDKTGLEEAIVKGDGLLNTIPVALGVTEFNFMGGSMGSVVGEELTRLIEFAAEKKMPLILVSGSGGGARMHEGILSLMQMAKTSAALARLAEAGQPFFSVLTNPPGGGVTASWAILGDLNFAEPGALIMFAGARVIAQTIRQRLPENFQRSEFLQDHGVIDQVVDRRKLKEALGLALGYLKRDGK
jgi:acetyl-CoA carboxylase carboxyl transferase subunit beta